MSLSNKALLVNLSISQWGGKRVDRKATNTVTTTHLTQSKVGNYTKKLLSGSGELDNIHNVAQKLRAFFYEQTLGWFTDGSRILKSNNYMDFTTAYRAKRAEFDRAVNDFIFAYPTLKEQDRIKLGDLFNENEYPDLNSLQECFSCELTIMPVPALSDFRVELAEDDTENFQRNMDNVEEQALKECWERLYEVVNKAVTRLSDPSTVLRDSLIENIQEMCNLLPKLNVNDDANLETARLDVQKAVQSISPGLCRDNDTARIEAAKKLADIMGAFQR